MPYATPDDLMARYPAADLAQLTGRDGAAPDAAVLARTLADAAAEIDGYLQGRYLLPLARPPAVLTQLVCDIAVYRLLVLRPLTGLEDARKRYDDAIARLRDIGRGLFDLGLSAGGEAPARLEEVLVAAAPRAFDRRGLDGF